tara:strand:- start:245 stop:910 length:666 start_codon:yes stop_codon:yes gene_type:complete
MSFDISKLILYKKKFIPEDECNLLIKYFEDNKNNSDREQCPEAKTGINTLSTFDVMSIPYGVVEFNIVTSALEKMINLYHEYTDQFEMFHKLRKQNMLYAHKIRLMKYEKGAKIHAHTDHDPHVYGSCTFNLNDDYEGGGFVFFMGKYKYELKKGDALIFPADHYWVHEVKPITKGVRYSTNCFLQSIPNSVKLKLWEEENLIMSRYKPSKEDGLKFEGVK